jgi:hypothetical protein
LAEEEESNPNKSPDPEPSSEEGKKGGKERIRARKIK